MYVYILPLFQGVARGKPNVDPEETEAVGIDQKFFFPLSYTCDNCYNLRKTFNFFGFAFSQVIPCSQPTPYCNPSLLQCVSTPPTNC